MKKNLVLLLILAMMVFCATPEQPVGEKIASSLGSKDVADSPFYIDKSTLPSSSSEEFKQLPIGIFDSGTGGLTVMEEILNSDLFENANHNQGPDGQADMMNEDFMYLGDLANMPYGNYPAEGRTDFLEELSVKDALFLLNTYYHKSPQSAERVKKPSVKVIVIACNTSTAYGKTPIEAAIDYLGLDIDVIGVIGAGALGVMESFKGSNEGTIGVMATVGTVASNSYPNTIQKVFTENGFTGKLDIFQQGGIGLAESIDSDPDYIDRELTPGTIRDNYKGPSLSNATYSINSANWKMYNFSEEGNELMVKRAGDQLEEVHINSIRNYVKYHVTELVVKMSAKSDIAPLKSIALGCTHYPYVEDEILAQLSYLAQYSNESGNKPYAKLLSNAVELVDPAVLTARETYLALQKRNALRTEGESHSSFFLSTPNMELDGVQANSERRFDYDYKYGRLPLHIEAKPTPPLYVLRVPMSWNMLPTEVTEQIKNRLGSTYKALDEFNKSKN